MLAQYIRRWVDLGVKLQVARCQSQRGSQKLTARPLRIYEDTDLNNLGDRNFLALDLKGSGLVCLDIESRKGSVEEFLEWIKSREIDLSSLFYETSLNGGLHIYFRHQAGDRKNLAHRKIGRMVFDVLFTGRAFTAPSQMGDKRYQWGPRSPFTIGSLQEIPEAPQWLLTDLISQSKSYKD